LVFGRRCTAAAALKTFISFPCRAIVPQTLAKLMEGKTVTTILINGEDRTRQIKAWRLSLNKATNEIELIWDRQRTPWHQCSIEPTEDLPGKLLLKKGNPNVQPIKHAQKVGNKYLLITYENGQRYPVLVKNAQVLEAADFKQSRVYTYFLQNAEARIACAEEDKRAIAENMRERLQSLPAVPTSTLNAYLNRTNLLRQPPENLIYPFGMNLSQIQAVERAFTSQISIIEGPPGTGKTQTILNIIANVLMQNKRVAIVSNNNSAVENVYEKLEQYGLGHAIAKLGSNKNKTDFFQNQPSLPDAIPEEKVSSATIGAAVDKVKSALELQYARARYLAEINELETETRYLDRWMQTQDIETTWQVEKYRFSPEKATRLMAWIQTNTRRRLSLRDRLQLAFRFGIIDSRPFTTREQRQQRFYRLQRYYYQVRLESARQALAETSSQLEQAEVDALVKTIAQDSLSCLKAHLAVTLKNGETFSEEDYRRKLSAFFERYPVIGSTTHSLLSSVGLQTQLDYVIVDEASQQDILPGIFALACARNVIVVGDRKQLAHVPAKLPQPIAAPIDHYDCQRHSLLHSLIDLYGDRIPITLLREHYRCHPKIIQFCNRQFYDNQLVIMTEDKGESALSLVVTAKGNHSRNYSNLREIESIEALEWNEERQRGFIAPFKAQVTLAEKEAKSDFVHATVHKFQGRECEEIVFSTVLDKKASARALDFVDAPRLINVALSRAKNRFVLVTGDEVFEQNNRHIAALVRYMRYYADSDEIYQSPVISAFDLLYDEYDRSLEALKARLDPGASPYRSEQIVARLTGDALNENAFNALHMHSQILLRQLVDLPSDQLSEREEEFMNQGASCDFVLYYRLGKQPAAVIEVDGEHHNYPDQAERDQLKQALLQKSNIPLLRLRTIDSGLEGRIRRFLEEVLSQQVPIFSLKPGKQLAPNKHADGL